jgi:hypothetical protein
MIKDESIIKCENGRWRVETKEFISKACFVDYNSAQKWLNKIKRSQQSLEDEEKIFFVKKHE